MRLLFIAAAILMCLLPSTARAQIYGDPSSLVDYWYRTYLGRAPDASGLATWTSDLNQGQSPDDVLATILGSDEYYARAGSTPEGYIRQLLHDILKREPTPSELDFWVRRMYLEDRKTIADEILTQNPGVWVGSTNVTTPPAVVTTPPVVVNPPVVVTPGIDWGWHRNWERDRRPDWHWHRDIHEYRRPEIHFHGDEHRDRHR
jgi:hypothetical protein